MSDFDEAAQDAQQMAKELSDHLRALKAMTTNVGIRRSAIGRKLCATIERQRRLSEILTEQLEEARAHGKKAEALQRLGHLPSEWEMVPPGLRRKP